MLIHHVATPLSLLITRQKLSYTGFTSMVKTMRRLFVAHRTNNHRPAILHPEGFVLLSIIVVGAFILTRTFSSTALPTILGFASSITPSQVVEQTNAQRLALGLGTLTNNAELSQAAAAKGNDMCAQQYWSHISPKGTTPWVFIKNAGYTYAVAGENLARDFADTGAMVTAWMASPTHRANIVNARYKDIGVAVLDCRLLGSDTALVVQMFGSELVNIPTTSAAGTTTKTVAAKIAPNPTPEPQGSVAGKESVPVLLENTNPTLKLETPPPQANPHTLRFLSPLQVVKAVMVSILIILFIVLFIDMWLEEKRHTLRLVGKNLAHIIFLFGIFLVVLMIKVGVIQ